MTTNGVPYPLNHAKTRQAAGEFKRARAERKLQSSPVTYEHFYKLFSDPTLSFTDICKRVKLSSKSVQRIYETYFIGIVSNDTGAERLHNIVLRRQEEALKAFTVPDKPGLKKVEKIASAAGLEVRPFVTPRSGGRLGRIAESKLRINGVACKIWSITACASATKGRNQRYAVIQMSKKNLLDGEIHIFVSLCDDLQDGPFIIPKEVLEEHIFKGADHGRVFIPTEQAKNKRGPQRLNPYRYNARWGYITRR